MSRGPGRVERAIHDLIDKHPEGAWTTADLCRLIYPTDSRVEKKHRVAVIRAAKTITDKTGDRYRDWHMRRAGVAGRAVALFNSANVMSYSLARLKCESSWFNRTEEQLLKSYDPAAITTNSSYPAAVGIAMPGSTLPSATAITRQPRSLQPNNSVKLPRCSAVSEKARQQVMSRPLRVLKYAGGRTCAVVPSSISSWKRSSFRETNLLKILLSSGNIPPCRYSRLHAAMRPAVPGRRCVAISGRETPGCQRRRDRAQAALARAWASPCRS